MSITLTIGLLAFLALLLTIKLDKKAVKPSKCQQCDDEYGNCWKCDRPTRKFVETYKNYDIDIEQTKTGKIIYHIGSHKKIIPNGFKSVNKL